MRVIHGLIFNFVFNTQTKGGNKFFCFSYYPLYPAPDDVNIDYDLWETSARLPVTPHILLLPSDLKAFAKVSVFFPFFKYLYVNYYLQFGFASQYLCVGGIPW